jgi:hypothetical protein
LWNRLPFKQYLVIEFESLVENKPDPVLMGRRVGFTLLE